MNIKRRLLMALTGLGLSTPLWAVAPDAITNLTAITGPEAGSVFLTWTAPAEVSQPVQEYTIRYRPNSPINSQTAWASSTLYPTAPSPLSPGNGQQYLVTQLTPGVSYYFAIVSRGTDTTAPFSALSNSPVAMAGLACTTGAHDGEGSVGVVPSSVQIGAETDFTFTFTASAQSILTDGRVGFRIPNGWTPPTTSGSAISTPGFVSYTIPSNGATVSITVDGMNVVVTVGTTALVNAAPIQIHYSNAYVPCSINTSETFLFASQQGPCGQMVPLSVSPNVTVTPGTADHISFNFETLPVQPNTIYPVELTVRDFCNNKVPVPAPINVSVQAQRLGTTNFETDPDAIMSLNSNLSSPFSQSGGDVPFAVGNSSRTFYYNLTSATFVTPRLIQSSHPTTATYPFYDQLTILPITGNIANVSVDTGAIVANQTTVTFTPDGDNNADVAFINFTMPTNVPYSVQISSDGFSTIARTIYGYGTTARIAWYGDTENYSTTGPEYAPPAVYAVRIADYSNTLTNQTLTMTLVAGGITGLIQDSSNSQPIANAEIRMQQNNIYRFGRTDATGRFKMFGLKAGNYQVHIERPGYLPKDVSVTISSGLLNYGTVNMDPAAVLKLHFTRLSNTTLPEVWGNLRANTSNWSSQAYASVHFPQGSIDSDAGDFWSTVPSSYSTLNLNPGVPYTVSLEIQGFGITPFTRTISNTQEETIALTPRPDISGTVAVPSGSNLYGMWISVEACIDASPQNQVCDNQDPSQRFYGGTYLLAGSSEGVHMIPGVNNGTYLLTARAPGFVSSKINTTVSSGVSVTNANFPVFSQGGTLTGNITVNGDTRPLDSRDGQTDGFFRLPINCWSPTTYQGSFTEVSIATNPTQATGSYSLSGLEDGTYQIFVNLQGFEVTPAGQINGTVASGTGTRNITMQEFTGSLSGLVTLPGSNTDFNNVIIDLLPNNQGYSSTSVNTVTTLSPDGSGNYSITKLGTGYYTLRAIYTTTGFMLEKSISIANGQAAQKNLNLNGTTYTLSGTVTTNASSPFNTLNYLVNTTTPTTVFNLSTNSGGTLPANRIVAERLRDNEYYNSPTIGGANGLPYDPRKSFFGIYYASGNYSISNLSPGVYRVYNNAELDNSFSNGNEIAVLSEVIHISGNTTKNFDLIDGYEISGQITIESGIAESNREMDILLMNTSNEIFASQRVTLNGTSATFRLENIPNGNYLLSMRDFISPVKYVARSVAAEVNGSNLSGKQIVLKNPARIQGTLRIATSGELLSNQNYSQFLTNEFRIEARSNPWAQGKYGFANYPLIDANNKFTVATLDGTYDLMLRTEGFIGDAAIAQGKKQFIAKTISGVTVVEGQTLDLGVLDLEEGLQIRGVVTDTSSTPLPNILVTALPAGSRHSDEALSATTNHLGQFIIYGADPALRYNVKAAPRPDRHDRRFQNYEGSLYGEVLRKNIIPGSAAISFQLVLAQGSVRGVVVTPDNGALVTPFDETPEPGATIIMNKVGNTPEDNPLGDIEIVTEPDGSFEVKGLVSGSYNLYALASGYANGVARNIQVGSTVVDIGNVRLSSGATLSGTLTKPDNSLPNASEINGLLAVRSGFEELIIARTVEDASGNITSYSISGFQNDKAYDIIYFDDDDEISVLTSGIIVNEDTELNFVLSNSQSPRAITQAKKNQDGSISITYEFTKPLRNSEIDLDNDLLPDDEELDERFTLLDGDGTLSIDIDALSSDRKRFVATYTPDAADKQFLIRADITFNALDASNEYFTLTQDTTFYIGIGARASEVITNLSGGSVELEDGSEFTSQPGTFGDGSDDSVEVTLSAADDTSEFAGANPRVSRAMEVASTLGLQAYPTGIASAMSKARATDISPFSSFYDIFLPVGVSHFFPEGSEASLCLNYDDSVTDSEAYSMNIYYFNEATNEYLLEQTNKTVDTENNLICASIAHASVFTILNSSNPILTGSGYTGELTLLNFPNPFSLKSKTVTLQDPGSLTASQTIDGTMIKMSIPATMAGSIEIQIFNVVGEKVRTLNSEASGGAHYYLQWDGKNDHGEKVASGTYIGRFTIGGANEKFFKMAVLK